MELKGCIHTPVSIAFNREDIRYKMFWYKDNPYFFYPAVFVSPFVTGMKRTRAKDFHEAEYIIADSGGFQIMSQKLNTGWLDILRWQEEIADVAFTLDTPCYSYDSEVEDYKYYTDEYFDRAMRQSNDTAWKMQEAKSQDSKMQLWGVVQGGHYEDLMKWYKDLTSNHTYQGYTLPLASTFNPKVKQNWLSQLQFVKEVNTNFHLLGRCEPLMVLVLAKLAQVTKKYYTYDTSSAAMGLMLGKYHEPYFMSSLRFSKIKPETRVNFTSDKLPCDCPVCSKHTFMEMVEKYYTLFMHNVYVRVRYNNYANVMCQDDEVFHELVNKFCNLQPTYRKNQDMLKSEIDKLIYGTEQIHGGVSDFF
jgi:tRNA-guanine family transglycosylase